MDNKQDKFERNTAQEGVQFDTRPDFLEGADKAKARAEKKVSSSEARDALNRAEAGAEDGGLYRNGAGASAQESEDKAAESYYTGSGKEAKKKKSKKFGVGKASAAITIVFLIVFMVAAIGTIGQPLYQLGAWDFGFLKLGKFTKTGDYLDALSINVEAEFAKEGKMPDKLAGELATHGMMVGQVAANGDFVRTNQYIANIEELKDLAVLGNYQVQPSEGELAILFKDEVITADNLVATINNNPEAYAAFTAAAAVPAKFYQDKADDVISGLFGINRGYATSFVVTGDAEKDMENFKELFTEQINKATSLQLGGYFEEATGGADDEDDNSSSTAISFSESVSGQSNAEEVTNTVAENTTGSNANGKGAQVINAAVSAAEPWRAGVVFGNQKVITEQARAGDNGPVNYYFNFCNIEQTVELPDVSTKQIIKETASIMTTPTLVAEMSDGVVSKKNAMNYGRDRGLGLTDTDDVSVLRDTTAASKGQQSSGVLMSLGLGEKADANVLSILNNSLDVAAIQDTSDLVTSSVGGNWTSMGAKFMSMMINRLKLGGMAADAAELAAYHKETEVYAARRGAAERATKSPFDISSPYTFMGSLMRGVSNAMMRSNASGNSDAGTVVGVLAELTNDSTKELWGSAMADNDDELGIGEGCKTVNSVSVVGDYQCTEQSTLVTKYMGNTQSDWQNGTLAGQFDGSGQIIEGSDLDEFVNNAMKRMTTVGIKDAEVCEKWRKAHGNALTAVGDFFSNLFDMYDVCSGVDGIEEAATGELWTNSSANSNKEKVEQFSAYVSYDMVRSIMSEEVSKVALAQERYLEKNPEDDSTAGRLARISGLTKSDAELALEYMNYLDMIARYNPATRYAFGRPLVEVEQKREPIVEHANQVAVELYVMWHGRTEYDDLRGRTQVV